jgi:hypothetical protein
MASQTSDQQRFQMPPHQPEAAWLAEQLGLKK